MVVDTEWHKGAACFVHRAFMLCFCIDRRSILMRRTVSLFLPTFFTKTLSFFFLLTFYHRLHTTHHQTFVVVGERLGDLTQLSSVLLVVFLHRKIITNRHHRFLVVCVVAFVLYWEQSGNFTIFRVEISPQTSS